MGDHGFIDVLPTVPQRGVPVRRAGDPSVALLDVTSLLLQRGEFQLDGEGLLLRLGAESEAKPGRRGV